MAKPSNYEWDFLIWILYDRIYAIQEAWLWGKGWGEALERAGTGARLLIHLDESRC